MIFAKVDVCLPRHYRIMDVRADCIRASLGIRSESDRTQAEVCRRIARAAAVGVWTAALCFSRDHMLDGFCPLGALDPFATDEIVDELVAQGLLVRAEREGRPGVVIVNYAKHNETKAEIERRLNSDRRRKKPERIPRGVRTDSDRISRGVRTDSDRIPCSETESETETETETDHKKLVAHFVAEFERLKGVKPVIGPRGGAGAKRLLQGRTLAEAKAIVDRALADPWWLDKSPDLAAIAGKINAFIGRRTPVSGGASPVPLQPPGGTWKKAEPTHD
jgi:hypothetical protein